MQTALSVNTQRNVDQDPPELSLEHDADMLLDFNQCSTAGQLSQHFMFGDLQTPVEPDYNEFFPASSLTQPYLPQAYQAGLSSPSTIMTSSEDDYGACLVDSEPVHNVTVRSPELELPFGRSPFSPYDEDPTSPLALKMGDIGSVEPRGLHNMPITMMLPAHLTSPGGGNVGSAIGSVRMSDVQNLGGSAGQVIKQESLPADVHPFVPTDNIKTECEADDNNVDMYEEQTEAMGESDQSCEPEPSRVATARLDRLRNGNRGRGRTAGSISSNAASIPVGEHERILDGRPITLNVVNDLSDMVLGADGRVKYSSNSRTVSHRCSYAGCSGSFARTEHLKRHYEGQHMPGVRTYACPIKGCSKTVRGRSDNVVQHIGTHLIKSFVPSTAGNSMATIAECEKWILEKAASLSEAEKLMASVTVRLRSVLRDKHLSFPAKDTMFPYMRRKAKHSKNRLQVPLASTSCLLASKGPREISRR